MNNTQENKENKLIKLENLELSDRNQRFDSGWNINNNLSQYIKNGNKEYKKNESQIALQLLKYESDLKDFLDLIDSIYDLGFDEDLENIYVINKNNSENKYIVAEGNRRVLALKLLYTDLKIPDLNLLNQKKQITVGENISNILDDVEDSSLKNLRKNYQKIIDIIQKSEKKLEYQMPVIVIHDDQVLNKIIHSRHVSGKVRGRRHWKTGKYYWNLYQFLKNKETIETIKKIAIKYNKTEKQINIDVSTSQWIINIIKKSLLFKNNEEITAFVNTAELSAMQWKFIVPSLMLKGFEKETNIYFFFAKKGYDFKKYEVKKDDKFYESQIFKKFAVLIMDLFIKHSRRKNNKSISTRKSNHEEEAKNKIKIFFEIKQEINSNTKWSEVKRNEVVKLSKKDIKNLLNAAQNEKEKKEITQCDSYLNLQNESKKYEFLFENDKVYKEIINLINLLFELKIIKKPRNLVLISTLMRMMSDLMVFAIFKLQTKIKFYLSDCKQKIKLLTIEAEEIQSEIEKWKTIDKEQIIHEEKFHWIRRNKLISIKNDLKKILKNKMDENKGFYKNEKHDDDLMLSLLDFEQKKTLNKIIHEPFNFFTEDDKNKTTICNLLEEILDYIQLIYKFLNIILAKQKQKPAWEEWLQRAKENNAQI